MSHGCLLENVEDWSGKGADIFGTVQRAFSLCDEHGLNEFAYDADGLGAGVRGDARVINEQRASSRLHNISAIAFRGSEGAHRPEAQDVKGRLNKDFFLNRKAQGWFALRRRFQETFRAVNGAPYDASEIISLSSACPALSQLCGELSQPTYSLNSIGKVIVDKVPDGAKSPNLADAVMILFAVARRQMQIHPDVLEAAARRAA